MNVSPLELFREGQGDSASNEGKIYVGTNLGRLRKYALPKF